MVKPHCTLHQPFTHDGMVVRMVVDFPSSPILSFPLASSPTECLSESALSVGSDPIVSALHCALLVCPVLSRPVLSYPCFALLSRSSHRVLVPTTTLVFVVCSIRETTDPRIDATVPVPRPSVLRLQVLASGGSDGHETTCSATRYREAREGGPLIAGIKRGRRRRSEGVQ